MIRSICVFSSSSNSVQKGYFQFADDLGKQIATRDIKLVYGGASVGLMGQIANAASKDGGEVIGVVPKRIDDLGVTNNDVEIILTTTMHDRKAKMHELSDGFIILPGGFGTLEETFEIITMKQLGYHQKPIIIVNITGFFDTLMDFLDELYESRFIKAGFREMYHVVDNIDAIFEYLENYQPPRLPLKVGRVI